VKRYTAAAAAARGVWTVQMQAWATAIKNGNTIPIADLTAARTQSQAACPVLKTAQLAAQEYILPIPLPVRCKWENERLIREQDS
jgi:hypothetical protein